MSKQAVVVVDLQNEYLPSGKLPLFNIEAVIDNAAKVIAHARKHAIPVIHIRHESISAEAPIFVKNTQAVEIIDQVAPLGNEYVITKNYPNSFLKTNLDQKLKADGIEQLTIIGAMSHMCIDATTRAASDLGYQCTVLEDACTTLDLEFKGQVVEAKQVHAALMAALAFAYAEVVSTSDYLQH